MSKVSKVSKKSNYKLSFYLLLISQVVSLVGGAILRFAISLHVLDLTGSAEIFATMIAVSFLPMVLFRPVSGALADRFSKKKLLVICDSANAVLAGFLAIMIFGGSQSIVLFGAVIASLTLIATLYGSTSMASLPAMLPQEELPKANGLFQGVKDFSNLVSPILAGFLFGAVGVNNLVGLSATIFFISAVLNIFIHIPFKPREMAGGAIATIASDIKAGFVYVTRENTTIFKMALFMTIIAFFYNAMFSVAFPYTLRVVFSVREELFGFASASIGAAMLVGSLLSGKLKKFLKLNYMPFYISLLGIISLPISLSMLLPPENYMTAFIVFTAGFVLVSPVFSLINILIFIHIQTNVPSQMVGKAISTVVFIAQFAIPVGSFIMGLTLEILVGAQFFLYISIALLTFLLGIIMKIVLAGKVEKQEGSE